MKKTEIKTLKKGTIICHKKKSHFFRGVSENGKALISPTKTGKHIVEVTPASIRLDSPADTED